jgi:hypothetical protein
MTNLARSSLALVLPALFGAAKSCALVNLFMICPRWSAGGEPTTTNSASDDGRLTACFDWSRPLFWVKFHYRQPPHSSWAPGKCAGTALMTNRSTPHLAASLGCIYRAVSNYRRYTEDKESPGATAGALEPDEERLVS